jgi:hypothetical protein
MTQREQLLENIKVCRKKHGKNSKETLKAIYKTVKMFPLYKGHLEDWLSNNHYKI